MYNWNYSRAYSNYFTFLFGLCYIVFKMKVMKVMLCKTAKEREIGALDKSKNWIYQVKIDGTRAIYNKGKFINRRGNNITDKFPEIQVGYKDVILDGEIADLTGNNFNQILMRNLQDKEKIKIKMKEIPCIYFVFDILEIDGFNCMDLSLRERLALLKRFFKKHKGKMKNVKLLDTYENGKELWELVRREGKEGIVAKHLESRYEGSRSWFWLKIKRFREGIRLFNGYEIMKNNKGITLVNKQGLRVACLGSQADEVKRLIDEKGCVKAEIQYLDESKEGMLRQPSFRGLVR